jgi:hypothetical protein
MNARILPAACLVFSLALPEVALARVQPAVAATPSPAAAVTPAPAATVAPTPTTTPVPVAAPVAATPTAAWESPAVVVAQVPAPVVSSPPPPRPVLTPPLRLRGGKQLIAAGAVTLGTFYFFSSLAGALVIDKGRKPRHDSTTGALERPDRRRTNYGRALLVPVAGPFIAMAYSDTAMQRWGAVLNGAAQVTGVVLVLAGMVRNARARRWERMSFGAGPAAGGATISLSGRF